MSGPRTAAAVLAGVTAGYAARAAVSALTRRRYVKDTSIAYGKLVAVDLALTRINDDLSGVRPDRAAAARLSRLERRLDATTVALRDVLYDVGLLDLDRYPLPEED